MCWFGGRDLSKGKSGQDGCEEAVLESRQGQNEGFQEGQVQRAFLYPRAPALRSWCWEGQEGYGWHLRRPSPTCQNEAKITCRAREQGRVHFCLASMSKPGHSHPPGRQDYAPGKTRNTEAVQGTLALQKSSLANCLQRAHAVFPGSGISPQIFPSLFIIF